ncbi:hypothetical protein CYMTET_15350, partial [Cymbomonas tetramitiformis]
MRCQVVGWRVYKDSRRVDLIPLKPGMRCTIGKLSDNTIVMDHNSVSRQHALIREDKHGQWKIEDLGSAHGTILNGKNIVEHRQHSLRN